MIGVYKNYNDYIVVNSSKLGAVISNYQEFITGIESIINNHKGYYVIYGDGTLLKRIDHYYTMDIHPSEYVTLVSPKLNRYQLEMSKEIFRIYDNFHNKVEIAKGTPRELLKIVKDSSYRKFYDIRNFEGMELECCITKTELLKYLDKLGANLYC